MANLILTLGIGEAGRQFLDLSLPLMRAYARRIGADCHVITEPSMSDPLMLNLEKFQIRHFFRRYRRILYLDADVLVAPDAPDIFRVVPSNRFAAWDEGSLISQTGCIQAIQRELGVVPSWRETFFNAGIFLASRRHADLFEPISPALARSIPSASASGRYSDQSYLNWKLASTGVPCCPLPVVWNWNPICGYIHPAARFVHFLGTGFFEPERDLLQPPQETMPKRLRQMQDLVLSFDHQIKPAEPALDLTVTSPGVRSCVPLPRYLLPAGNYAAEILLNPHDGPDLAPIRCTLFGKKQEELTIAEWRWAPEEVRVTRLFSTQGLEYPQFCFDSPAQAARVSSLRIRWEGKLLQPGFLDRMKARTRPWGARLRRGLDFVLRPLCPHDTVS